MKGVGEARKGGIKKNQVREKKRWQSRKQGMKQSKNRKGKGKR